MLINPKNETLSPSIEMILGYKPEDFLYVITRK